MKMSGFRLNMDGIKSTIETFSKHLEACQHEKQSYRGNRRSYQGSDLSNLEDVTEKRIAMLDRDIAEYSSTIGELERLLGSLSAPSA
ncbi:hypothetical protein J4729_01270 [Leisingera sp. HS039]|uniref:hypothetical protein n=2 Tax=unclassified Leisingera TaxID=2614906 RepID=UPI001B3A346A|nr:hypothetical protein [Leisingera sp. HS039]MBQ4823189.1 hypothetical protein [Leisingera sp. HS039]